MGNRNRYIVDECDFCTNENEIKCNQENIHEICGHWNNVFICWSELPLLPLYGSIVFVDRQSAAHCTLRKLDTLKIGCKLFIKDSYYYYYYEHERIE